MHEWRHRGLSSGPFSLTTWQQLNGATSLHNSTLSCVECGVESYMKGCWVTNTAHRARLWLATPPHSAVQCSDSGEIVRRSSCICAPIIKFLLLHSVGGSASSSPAVVGLQLKWSLFEVQHANIAGSLSPCSPFIMPHITLYKPFGLTAHSYIVCGGGFIHRAKNIANSVRPRVLSEIKQPAKD